MQICNKHSHLHSEFKRRNLPLHRGIGTWYSCLSKTFMLKLHLTIKVMIIQLQLSKPHFSGVIILEHVWMQSCDFNKITPDTILARPIYLWLRRCFPLEPAVSPHASSLFHRPILHMCHHTVAL